MVTGDVVGADMARKFLQMGYTHSRRHSYREARTQHCSLYGYPVHLLQPATAGTWSPDLLGPTFDLRLRYEVISIDESSS